MREKNQETQADIIAEMRMGSPCGPCVYRIGLPDKEEVYESGAKRRITMIKDVTVQELADRLEAAAKREKAQHGNAAAMREALVQCELFLGNVSRHGHPTLCLGDQCTACNGVDELRGMVVRAISAPARNCDMPYNDRVEMYGAFKDWCKAKGHTMEPMLAYDAFDWLIAPAAERKGQGK